MGIWYDIIDISQVLVLREIEFVMKPTIGRVFKPPQHVSLHGLSSLNLDVSCHLSKEIVKDQSSLTYRLKWLCAPPKTNKQLSFTLSFDSSKQYANARRLCMIMKKNVMLSFPCELQLHLHSPVHSLLETDCYT